MFSQLRYANFLAMTCSQIEAMVELYERSLPLNTFLLVWASPDAGLAAIGFF